MLKKIYLISRIVAYISTLTGIGLLFWGRSMGGPGGERLQTASAGFVVVGFSAFLISYAIYVYSRFMKS